MACCSSPVFALRSFFLCLVASLFNECIIDDNQKRMFQLYSVQQTAHKVCPRENIPAQSPFAFSCHDFFSSNCEQIMSDALMSSLHEFWMKNNDFVTSDMLSTIFGPSCAQTKLISDPKGSWWHLFVGVVSNRGRQAEYRNVSCEGPVVYLHAEAGETATRVFQYILERSALFIHELHPDDDVPVNILRHDVSTECTARTVAVILFPVPVCGFGFHRRICRRRSLCMTKKPLGSCTRLKTVYEGSRRLRLHESNF